MWKMANVLPIHKSEEKNNVNNYRPISLLSCLGKIFERCVFKYTFNYLRDNKLISTYQSGFTSGDSTVNQLVNIYHETCSAIDAQNNIQLIFFDISKAFDKVWHKGLERKLKCIGIHPSEKIIGIPVEFHWIPLESINSSGIPLVSSGIPLEF